MTSTLICVNDLVGVVASGRLGADRLEVLQKVGTCGEQIVAVQVSCRDRGIIDMGAVEAAGPPEELACLRGRLVPPDWIIPIPAVRVKVFGVADGGGRGPTQGEKERKHLSPLADGPGLSSDIILRVPLARLAAVAHVIGDIDELVGIADVVFAFAVGGSTATRLLVIKYMIPVVRKLIRVGDAVAVARAGTSRLIGKDMREVESMTELACQNGAVARISTPPSDAGQESMVMASIDATVGGEETSETAVARDIGARLTVGLADGLDDPNVDLVVPAVPIPGPDALGVVVVPLRPPVLVLGEAVLLGADVGS